METAARSTSALVKRGNVQGGTRVFGPCKKYSTRDPATNTSLKPRNTQDERYKRNLLEEVENRERRHYSSKEDRKESTDHLFLEDSRPVYDDTDVEIKSDSDEDNDDDYEDRDTKALKVELEKIKKERAEDKLQSEKSQREDEVKALNNATSFGVKRRWDDDIVFKNQTHEEAKTAERFVNDIIRNEFHRKFLRKYMVKY